MASKSSHLFPYLLPGGRQLTYLVRSAQQDHRGLFLGSLDDPTLRQRVLPDDSNAVFALNTASDGYLFFVRDRTLLAQRFDPSDRRGCGGDAIVVVPISCLGKVVESGRSARRPVRSSTRRWIAPHNRLLWVDQRGTPQGAIGPERVDYDYIALSPDDQIRCRRAARLDEREADLGWLIRNSPWRNQFTVNWPKPAFPSGRRMAAGSSTLRRRPAPGISTRVP